MSDEYIHREDRKVKYLSPAELERSRTWLSTIFDTLREGVHWRREGDEYRAGGHGGLTINTRKGRWYHHSTRRNGWNGISLVKFLTDYNTAAATEWLVAFLQEHPGIGTPVAEGNDDHNIESANDTREHLENLVDVAGTPAETYLRSRGIAGPIPDFIKYRPHARCGEGAIAVPLQARDRVVGLQLGYLDPDGRKSTITPNRRRFALEKAPDAVFEFPKPNDATDLLADTLVVEGLENALSLAELGRSVRIVGLPGIGTLQNLPVRKGERILIVRDGDKPGSGADKGLIAGVDHLLLEGAIVHITHTPPGDDANSILESDGQAALQELLTNTTLANFQIKASLTDWQN